MSEQTIGQRMQARKSEAETKVKGMLWSGADADAIAGVALAGGIDPAWIDKQAAEIEAAQATLRKAVEAHGREAGTARKLATARTAAEKARATLAQAQSAAGDAEAAQGAIEAEAAAIRAAIDTAARALQGGAIRADKAPEFLTALVAEWDMQEKASRLAGERAEVRRKIDWFEANVAQMRKLLESEKADDPDKERCEAGPSGLVKVQDILTGRIATQKQQLKDLKSRLAELDKQG